MKIPDESEYIKLLPHFPQVEFAFAYGSGAVRQGGYKYDDPSVELPMIDIIFAVTDPIQWHMENTQKNPDHYTCSFDVDWMVKQIQGKDASGPALWFNVDIAMDGFGFPGRRMKYGVVSVSHLMQDLTAWDSLYIAGRLHKPLHIVKYHDAIMTATKTNREFALKTALLLLPASFSEAQLYTTVAGLSYMGDQRMLVGAENLNKVDNLVLSKIPSFRALYEKPLQSIAGTVGLQTHQLDNEENIRYSQDMQYMLSLPGDYLPSHLRSIMASTTGSGSKIPRNKLIVATSSQRRAANIQRAIKHIVSRASGRQTLVNLACVGVGKGFSYVLAKVMKRIKSSK